MTDPILEDVREIRAQQNAHRSIVADHEARMRAIEASLTDLRTSVKEIRDDVRRMADALTTSRTTVAKLAGLMAGVGVATGGAGAGLLKLLLG